MNAIAWLLTAASCCPAAGTAAPGYARLPANAWTTVHREDRSGGKAFARVIYVPNTDRLYLWGTGGAKPARNVYRRYELESFDPREPAWRPAFPDSRRGAWKPNDFPRFRIYGQTGPDGLKYDEGPRLQVVGGYHSTNRVRWWDFDGVRRPSPIHTFNMICLDSRRNRVVCYADGCTFALDPADNTWTDLAAKNHPACCRALAWAALCYNPVRDEIILFGGGLATNPAGGATTWIYDCAENAWRRPDRETEPPPRCNAPIVYDPATRSAVMFGGYDQAAALNDTWVYRCEDGRWEKATPATAPPPMYAPAAAAVPGGGKILVCGNDARRVRMRHKAASAERKETWVYDIAAGTWTPVDGDLRLRGHRWLTAAAAPRHGVVFMTAFGPDRRTLAFRCDPDAEPADLPGAPPGTVAWKYPEQSASLENAPPADPASRATVLASLPPNRFVNAEPPGMLISKTWSSATIDTDRGAVIYTGGGHSGYSGNDIARYRIAENRWRLDFPPRFPPFLESTNAGIFGWSYGMIPFSQHTYLWYCYDPRSKTVVYLARPSLFDGVQVRLGSDPGDTFVYDRNTHGCATWCYDSAAKKMHPPCFGRPFANTWHLALAGTPAGVYALSKNTLYHATVNRDDGTVTWRTVDTAFPKPERKITYHYEFQPLLHDTKRGRLVLLKGDENRVDVYARPLDPGGSWHQVETSGAAAIGREAVYIPRHDTILWLADRQLFSFDCARNRLAELDVDLPAGRYTHECAMVYDPHRDLCVALVPARFSGPLQTLLFRFDPATATYTGRRSAE